MEIVWEAYHKGVPFLGVPGITLDVKPRGFEVWRRWLRYGNGAAPNLSSFSPTDVCTKEHLGNKKLAAEEKPAAKHLRKTHIWRVYGDNLEDFWKYG